MITNRETIPSRRAAALLVVLAVLMIVVTAAAGYFRTATTTRLATNATESTDLTNRLLDGADGAVRSWLEHESSSVVLEPGADQPRIDILDDQLTIESTNCRITITAWDQLGMVAWDLVEASDPIAAFLPESIRRSASGNGKPAEPLGLDQFQSTSVFPSRSGTNDSGTSDPALGALIATHQAGNGAVNLNTASMELIERALRSNGRSGIEVIRAARQEGESAPIGDLVDSGNGDRRAPRLVTSSTLWSFRIDCSAGTVTRSWWATYTRDRNTWRCIQRLAIDE